MHTEGEAESIASVIYSIAFLYMKVGKRKVLFAI